MNPVQLPQGAKAEPVIVAAVILSAAGDHPELATAIVTIRGNAIPGFQVMQGRYGKFVTYPTGAYLVSKEPLATLRRVSEVVMDAYRGIVPQKEGAV